jgi:predicted nucleic acid-binding protein
MIVLDANILIRAILGRRVRGLIEQYSEQGIRFFAPQEAFRDVRRYLPALLKKFHKNDTDLRASIEYLQQIVETIEYDLYSAFEAEARTRLHGRDEDDWPVLASALALGCAAWIEDTDFFGTGIAVWTTNREELYLKPRASEKAKNG